MFSLILVLLLLVFFFLKKTGKMRDSIFYVYKYNLNHIVENNSWFLVI